MDEIFRKIDGYENYQISNLGRVINNKTNKILKPGINSSGYLYVNLCKNGKQKNYLIHRLVALSFINNPENKNCVDHINNVRTDNCIENLRWATHRENSQNRQLSSDNTSGCKGVYFNKQAKKWYSHIIIDGVCKHLGYFNTIEEAKEARRQKAIELFGEFINDCEL